MTFVERTLELASRRNIRSSRDLWLYVGRMTIYIATLTALVTGVQARAQDPGTIVLSMIGAAVACAILAIPITWEFGRMYLDLWQATQSLHTLARTDLQTGLLNNRTFVALIEERLEAGHEVALLLGDLDRFKAINDRHGHPKGDEVIAAVGGVMRDLFAAPIPIGRMGGEEFAVAIDCPFSDPEANLRHCEAFADELRKRIGAIRIETEAKTIAPTISIGIARSTDVEGFSELYARADKALYVAKAAGRNRVVDESAVEIVEPARRDGAEPGDVRVLREAMQRF
jgi:diguanylate cyclase (GGDEF)-like protein